VRVMISSMSVPICNRLQIGTDMLHLSATVFTLYEPIMEK